MRRALANTLNVPAVEVMEKVGIDTLLSQAPQFGIHSLKDKTYYGKGLSLVLGSAEVSPLEMASAYSTFAANGKRPEPLFITEVRDKYGAILEKAHVKSTRVVSAESAYFINSILSDNAARSESFGSLLTIPYPAAVKTGTTDSYRDAWTVGYTPKLVTAVWVGNNDASYIKNVPGSLAAAPIWKKLMTYYSSTYGYENFSRPDSIVRAVMCVKNSSGSARLEYFIRGRQPKQNCQEQIAPNVASADKTQPQIGGGAPSPTPEAPTISPEPTTGQL